MATAVVRIVTSVGMDGTNDDPDVRIVQTLLNKVGAQLHVDGDCGRKTVGAICDFQRRFLSQPDGLIEPHGTTFGKLCSGAILITHRWAPLGVDAHHYKYCGAGEDVRDRQWGTLKAIATCQEICRNFHTKHQIKLGVGDISLVQGGPMNGHTTGHRIGKNVDIRPVRKDRAQMPITVRDAQYDKEKSLALAKIIEALPNVRKVFFGDSYVVDNTGVKVELEAAKHHNHFHVETVE